MTDFIDDVLEQPLLSQREEQQPLHSQPEELPAQPSSRYPELWRQLLRALRGAHTMLEDSELALDEAVEAFRELPGSEGNFYTRQPESIDLAELYEEVSADLDRPKTRIERAQRAAAAAAKELGIHEAELLRRPRPSQAKRSQDSQPASSNPHQEPHDNGPGADLATWLIEMEHPGGIVIDEEVAQIGPCQCIALNGSELCFHKGIIGALDEAQQAQYCIEKVYKDVSPARLQRIAAFRAATEVCKAETAHLPEGQRLVPRLKCMERELRKKGVELT